MERILLLLVQSQKEMFESYIMFRDISLTYIFLYRYVEFLKQKFLKNVTIWLNILVTKSLCKLYQCLIFINDMLHSL